MASGFVSEEDEEDFEQEKLIQEWLANGGGKTNGFDFKYISRKGTARNSRVRASISLDQQVSEDSAGTFADIIAGSDGRDLYCGEDPQPEAYFDAYLFFLGFDEETTEWLVKTLKLSTSQNRSPFERFLIDSEW